MADKETSDDEQERLHKLNSLHRRRITSDPRRGDDEPSGFEQTVYYRRCQGWTYRRIGQKYNIADSTIAAICRKVAKWRRAICGHLIDTARQIHTDVDYDIVEESWRGWRRSKKDEVTITKTADHNGVAVRSTRKGQCGDTAYLKEIGAALERIEKREGIGPPMPEGSGVVPAGLQKISRIRRLQAVLENALQIELANQDDNAPDTIVIEPSPEKPGNGEAG